MFLFTLLVLAAALAIWRMSRPIEAPRKPLPDRRRRLRRDRSERRDEIRFAAQADRRTDPRRGNERLWTTPGYQR